MLSIRLRSLAAALLVLPLAAAAAAPPSTLQLGSVTFQRCELGARRAGPVPTQRAWCATVDVPENHAAPAGRRIGLRVALIPALAPDPDPDLVTFLDGGPGGAATEDYPAVAGAFAPLRRHRHILLIDQRGTGGSNALDCSAAPALDDEQVPVGAAAEARQREQLRRCLDEVTRHAAPQFYATTDAVLDLEAVRRALGGPRLDLVGVSYGTRVAQQYASRFPEAVRAIVLDSPVPNPLVLLSEHARNLEDALQRRLARCAAVPACAQRHGESYAALRRVQARLREHPQTIRVHDPQTFAESEQVFGADFFAALVRFYLYSPVTSALLPLVISEAQDGHMAPLVAQAKFVVGDITERMNGGMSASVMCTEDADLLHEDARDADTLLGSGPVRAALRTCQVWPHGERPAGFHDPFHSSLPVLVLAGEFDPVTPARYGEQIVQALSRARLLVAPGQGHAVLSAGCVPRLVEEFLRTADPARPDGACLQLLGEEGAFLDANGAGP